MLGHLPKPIRSSFLLSALAVARDAELGRETFLNYSETGSGVSGAAPRLVSPPSTRSFPSWPWCRRVDLTAIVPFPLWNVFSVVTGVAECSKHLKRVGWVLSGGLSAGCPGADVASATAAGLSARGGQGLQSRPSGGARVWHPEPKAWVPSLRSRG